MYEYVSWMNAWNDENFLICANKQSTLKKQTGKKASYLHRTGKLYFIANATQKEKLRF